jgi:hypothetical protein
LFSPGPPVSSTNKGDSDDIAEILLKVALSTIKQTNKQTIDTRDNGKLHSSWLYAHNDFS